MNRWIEIQHEYDVPDPYVKVLVDRHSDEDDRCLITKGVVSENDCWYGDWYDPETGQFVASIHPGDIWKPLGEIMNKLDMLWIRACKSENPEQRVRTLYRRFYTNLGNEHAEKQIISELLTNVVEKYCSYKLSYLLADINPKNMRWIMHTHVPSYYERVFDTMINYIRLTRIDELPDDFIKGAKWRNNE